MAPPPCRLVAGQGQRQSVGEQADGQRMRRDDDVRSMAPHQILDIGTLHAPHVQVPIKREHVLEDAHPIATT